VRRHATLATHEQFRPDFFPPDRESAGSQRRLGQNYAGRGRRPDGHSVLSATATESSVGGRSSIGPGYPKGIMVAPNRYYPKLFSLAIHLFVSRLKNKTKTRKLTDALMLGVPIEKKSLTLPNT